MYVLAFCVITNPNNYIFYNFIAAVEQENEISETNDVKSLDTNGMYIIICMADHIITLSIYSITTYVYA